MILSDFVYLGEKLAKSMSSSQLHPFRDGLIDFGWLQKINPPYMQSFSLKSIQISITHWFYDKIA